MIKPKKVLAGITLAAVLLSWQGLAVPHRVLAAEYTVKSGDSLWSISKQFNTTIQQVKLENKLTSDAVFVGQKLNITEYYVFSYTVKSGDNLWGISKRFSASIDSIKQLNGLTSDSIYVGQVLKIKTTVHFINYTVVSGDSLWKVAYNHNTTIARIKELNNITTDYLSVGQALYIHAGSNLTSTAVVNTAPAVTAQTTTTNTAGTTAAPGTVQDSSSTGQTSGTVQNTNPTETTTEESVPVAAQPQPVLEWPAVTYIVQPGDTAGSIAKKFGTTSADVLKYNYMNPDQWFDAGEKIAISGYAPRTYTVVPGETLAPARTGKVVDWFTEGQYLLKRWDEFLITDVDTGKSFKVKMIGGYNHSDIEPLTAQDTAVMKELFNNTWTWAPRAVVVFKDGMNIAASLSGMPHGTDVVKDNNITGMVDLYLYNSIPHGTSTSTAYVQQHYDMILKAAGK